MRAARGNVRARPEEGSAGFGVPDGWFVTDRQLMPAPGAAPCQHGSAILALHAGAESVRLGALAIIWLKCAFRHAFFLVSERANRLA